MSFEHSRKNEFFNHESIDDYRNEYSTQLSNGLAAVDSTLLEQTAQLMRRVRREGQRVYVAGNGGSSATSDHLTCDWAKGTGSDLSSGIRAFSLTNNTALMMAIANDLGFEHVFSQQLNLYATQGDLVVLVSASGSSPNILKAAEVAREKSLHTVGMTGFDGGELMSMVDVCLHVPISNYGVVEDAHQALMHILTQYTYLKCQEG